MFLVQMRRGEVSIWLQPRKLVNCPSVSAGGNGSGSGIVRSSSCSVSHSGIKLHDVNSTTRTSHHQFFVQKEHGLMWCKVGAGTPGAPYTHEQGFISDNGLLLLLISAPSTPHYSSFTC